MRLSFSQAIHEIKNRLDIVSVIQRYQTLRRSGTNNYVGICPFHNDSKPSMTVSTSKNIFKCFACGTGGDIYKYIQEKDNMSFADTVHKLAQECGIEIEKQQQKNLIEHEIFYTLNQVATEYYINQLNQSNNYIALNYLLDERELSTDIIKEFQLGFAPWPNATNNLLAYMSEHHLLKDFDFNNQTLLIESGLFLQNSDDNLRERFINRLIIPIHDLDSRVIAFGSRVLPNDDSPAKYINSPETPIYHKSYHLYNLNRAREYTRTNNKVLLLEGYFDVIKAYQHNIKYSVASLGTAFTDSQAKLLYNSNLNRHIILGYDNDEAGKKAIISALKIIQNITWKDYPKIHYLDLVEYEVKDIDELLMKHNENYNINTLIDQSSEIYKYIIHKTHSKTDSSDNIQRQSNVKYLLDLIQNIKEPIFKEVLIEEIANIFVFTKKALLQQIAHYKQPTQYRQRYTFNKLKNKSINQSALSLLALYLCTDHQDIKDEIQSINLEDSYLEYIKNNILLIDLDQEVMNNPESKDLARLMQLIDNFKALPSEHAGILEECKLRFSDEQKAINSIVNLHKFK